MWLDNIAAVAIEEVFGHGIKSRSCEDLSYSHGMWSFLSEPLLPPVDYYSQMNIYSI